MSFTSPETEKYCFYIYQVITSPEKEKRFTYYLSLTHVYRSPKTSASTVSTYTHSFMLCVLLNTPHAILTRTPVRHHARAGSMCAVPEESTLSRRDIVLV